MVFMGGEAPTAFLSLAHPPFPPRLLPPSCLTLFSMPKCWDPVCLEAELLTSTIVRRSRPPSSRRYTPGPVWVALSRTRLASPPSVHGQGQPPPDLPFAPTSDLLPRCSLSPEPSALAPLWGLRQTPVLPWPPWPHVSAAFVPLLFGPDFLSFAALPWQGHSCWDTGLLAQIL